jgi:hypothetical protein
MGYINSPMLGGLNATTTVGSGSDTVGGLNATITVGSGSDTDPGANIDDSAADWVQGKRPAAPKMGINVLGGLGDPKQDAAAIKPLVEEAVASLTTALQTLFDGYSITITIQVEKNK